MQSYTEYSATDVAWDRAPEPWITLDTIRQSSVTLKVFAPDSPGLLERMPLSK